MNEIVTTTETNNALAYTPSEYSTLSIKDAETRKTVLNAMNNAQSLNDACKADPERVFEVIGCFTQPGIRRARKQGDADQPCTNTTIVCADGSAYFTQSEGIRRSMDLFSASGVFDDGDVVPMKVVTKEIPGGNTIKTVVLV